MFKNNAVLLGGLYMVICMSLLSLIYGKALPHEVWKNKHACHLLFAGIAKVKLKCTYEILPSK